MHLHWGGCPELAEALVEKCRSVDVEAVNRAVTASEAVAPMLDGSCAQTVPSATSVSNINMI